MRVAVVGAGNFGTVIANIVAGNGIVTSLYTRDQLLLRDMTETRENHRYLPNHRLHDNVKPTSDFDTTISTADLVFVVVPSVSFREASKAIGRRTQPGTNIVSGTKGVEGPGFKLMSQILGEEIEDCPIGVLSGPNLAEEIAAGQIAGTVIASEHEALNTAVVDVLRSPTLRVYSSDDVYGVELGGALKNIYAIICGMAAALKMGQNTTSMVITRSLAEMSRFAASMGANPFTFLGLAGVGDLVATCTSPHSRNYQLGFKIASGLTLDAAMESLGKLAEGVNTLSVVYERKRHLDVYMPLADALYRILFHDDTIDSVIGGLMSAEQQVDVEFATPNSE